MNILLDTHAAIWFFENNKKLSKSVLNAICDLDNTVYVSIVSIWEIAIKLNTGKWNLDGGIDSFINAIYRNDFEIYGISVEQVKKFKDLPLIHRDPFDRMLITQSITGNMTIATIDENIQKYDVSWVW